MQRQADEAAAFRQEADDRYEAALMELLAERSRTAGLEVRGGKNTGMWPVSCAVCMWSFAGYGCLVCLPACLLAAAMPGCRTSPPAAP